ncbi:substrate-binding periplasmic protein [Zooshikella ganghwensis]|uniref:substrate-binding periplasmic protein n=1 Tax=Zooshikella ganghwensis TaxID=202772 RepID=UPI00041D3149|nr:transporter substrate-binding domain-containing protein [Zooshikella ganghwensis]
MINIWHLALWLAVIFSCNSYSDDLIVSGHSSYPPVSQAEGELITGIGAKVIAAIANQLGISYRLVSSGPWKRVHWAAEKGKIDMIAGVYLNEHRTAYLDYAEWFMTDPVVIFVKKGNAFPYRQWKDLIGRKGSTNLGESFGEAFDRFIEKYLYMEWEHESIDNFRKLAHGRIDYFLYGLYPASAQLKVHGYEDVFEVIPTPVVEEKFYFAFSKHSKFRYLKPKMNAVIVELRESGIIQRWVDEFFRR